MLVTAMDAKAKLEAEGLYVSCNNAHALWVAGTVRAMDAGIKLSEDACGLILDSGGWVAVFPAKGLYTFEVPGSLAELVTLITTIYAHHRQAGGPFTDSFEQVVSEPEQYLVGRAPARV